jgi:hypothetical protein
MALAISIFRCGLQTVVKGPQRILQHTPRFFECDAMLLLVGCSFVVFSFEIQFRLRRNTLSSYFSKLAAALFHLSPGCHLFFHCPSRSLSPLQPFLD